MQMDRHETRTCAVFGGRNGERAHIKMKLNMGEMEHNELSVFVLVIYIPIFRDGSGFYIAHLERLDAKSIMLGAKDTNEMHIPPFIW
jgi:hypothetical protein